MSIWKKKMISLRNWSWGRGGGRQPSLYFFFWGGVESKICMHISTPCIYIWCCNHISKCGSDILKRWIRAKNMFSLSEYKWYHLFQFSTSTSKCNIDTWQDRYMETIDTLLIFETHELILSIMQSRRHICVSYIKTYCFNYSKAMVISGLSRKDILCTVISKQCHADGETLYKQGSL